MAPRRGSQAVEFALVLPILLGLLSGAVDAGTYLARTTALVHAASDGARAGARDAEASVATALSEANASWESAGFWGEPTFTAEIEGDEPVRRVVVSVRLAFEPYFGFVPVPDVLRYSCAFRLETQGED